MRIVLGLDLGTNSIGWALIDADEKKILGMGSRIIPMSQDIMGEFDKGNSVSQTAERTGYRGVRRLRERTLLRRERLHRVLNVLGFLPEHYAKEIDFEKHFGQFLDEKEPKLAWKKNEETGKFEFLFQKSFLKMAEDFKANGQDIKIPYDWTIYYLRKKARSQKIEKEELAWLLLNFNQKRGYYQLRGEEDEDATKTAKTRKYFDRQIIKNIIDTNEIYKGLKVLLVELANGTKGKIFKKEIPQWIGIEKNIIATVDIDTSGNDKYEENGLLSQRFSIPTDAEWETEWKLIKLKTEKDLQDSQKTVGTYIYETLLKNPTQKIRGKLVRTIERKYYKDELIAILKKQIELQPELFSEQMYSDCVRELYRSNIERQTILSGRDFLHLFVNDILFYQRPLRSQKSSIGNCTLEFREHKINKLDENSKEIKNVFEKDENGNDKIVKEYLKAIPKSNPYYQEFRVWQWLYNLKIYTRDDDQDVTAEFITSNDDKEKLFDFLNNRKEIDNKALINYLLEQKGMAKKEISKELKKYRWNYVFDNSKEKEEDKSKKYPCNETKTMISTRLAKVENVPANFLTSETEYELWHIIYSVTDKNEFEKALLNFAIRNSFSADIAKSKNKEIKRQIIEFSNGHKQEKYDKKEDYQNDLNYFIDSTFDENVKSNIYFIISFFDNFKKFKPFESQYGSFSEKAIKKLLPLMRLGKYWNENAISKEVKEQADSIKQRLDEAKKIAKDVQKQLEKIDFNKQRLSEISDNDNLKTILEKILNEYDKKYLEKINYEEQFLDQFSDDDVQKRVLKSFLNKKDMDFTQGLQLYQASYLVYGRHSEAENADQWKMSYDIQKYLYEFRQHELRNPIVEQVITETLRTVKDIWEHYAENNKIPYVLVYDEHKKKNVKSYPKFFEEIHIELGREMKNTAEDRAKITNQVSDNENTNLRIKAMLMEFANDDYFKNQDNYKDKEGETPDFYKKGNNPVRPYSQNQQDILKIYESDVLNNISKEELDKETGLTETKDGKTKQITYKDISKKSSPTKAEIDKYKLWLEQKYCSPYTGKTISLSKLFTPEYEIEHVIPQSRYFDDSLSNKVICEAAVNKLKDRYLGLEFIKKHAGEKVECGMGKVVEISSEENYKKFVTEHYKNNNAKRKKLLMEEIPDKMIERQLNDTRYISKLVAQLLSNIVREDSGDDGVNSKNFIPGNGKITDKLKKDWGLNDVWNELILPRFQRMNELTQTEKFTSKNNEGHTIPAIPLELAKGFQKKRIDHRHHAMDALVIACMQREHVQYLNNENAKSQKFHLQQGLAKTIRNFETVQKEVFEKDSNNVWKVKKDAQGKQITKEIQVPKDYKKPWGIDENIVLAKSAANFTDDAKKALEKIVVSFKQNLRVVNKATNQYEKIKDGKKIKLKQEGTNWAIRKSLHKDTVFAKVYLLSEVKEMTLKKVLEKIKETKDVNIIVDKKLREIIKHRLKFYNDEEIQLALKDKELENISRIKVFEQKAATRFLNDLVSVFNGITTVDKAKETIKKITDTGIQRILTNHLTAKDNKPEIAFSPEGIDDMNKNIVALNNGKFHQPIYKVRIYQALGNKFQVGQKGNKKDKYVEAAKGTNLFFAIYADENGSRSYETIPLNIVIERLKQGLNEVPEINEKGHNLLFHLSPNDLVYVPTEDEKENIKNIDWNNLDKEQIKRIFVVNDFSSTCYFTPNHIAKNIAPKEVDLSLDKEKNKISGSFDTKTASFEGKQIKDVCIKLKINRLGSITL